MSYGHISDFDRGYRGGCIGIGAVESFLGESSASRKEVIVDRLGCSDRSWLFVTCMIGK